MTFPVQLYRLVDPTELSDIESNNNCYRLVPGKEGKYFFLSKDQVIKARSLFKKIMPVSANTTSYFPSCNGLYEESYAAGEGKFLFLRDGFFPHGPVSTF